MLEPGVTQGLRKSIHAYKFIKSSLVDCKRAKNIHTKKMNRLVIHLKRRKNTVSAIDYVLTTAGIRLN